MMMQTVSSVALPEKQETVFTDEALELLERLDNAHVLSECIKTYENSRTEDQKRRDQEERLLPLEMSSEVCAHAISTRVIHRNPMPDFLWVRVDANNLSDEQKITIRTEMAVIDGEFTTRHGVEGPLPDDFFLKVAPGKARIAKLLDYVEGIDRIWTGAEKPTTER